MLGPALSLCLLLRPAALPEAPPAPAPTAESVLAELKAGNQRFVAGQRTRSQQSAEDPRLRAALAGSQRPLAVVVACSDSRVSENYIFDQELGRLFTIRVAGNSPDTLCLASAEFAVERLGCGVIVVLGHTRCGAVAAVADAGGTALPGHYAAFQAAMGGLLQAVPERPGEAAKAYHDRLAAANAVRQAHRMVRHSRLLRARVASGRLKVVPAMYDLASGRVTFLEEGAAAP